MVQGWDYFSVYISLQMLIQNLTADLSLFKKLTRWRLLDNLSSVTAGGKKEAVDFPSFFLLFVWRLFFGQEFLVQPKLKSMMDELILKERTQVVAATHLSLFWLLDSWNETVTEVKLLTSALGVFEGFQADNEKKITMAFLLCTEHKNLCVGRIHCRDYTL